VIRRSGIGPYGHEIFTKAPAVAPFGNADEEELSLQSTRTYTSDLEQSRKRGDLWIVNARAEIVRRDTGQRRQFAANPPRAAARCGWARPRTKTTPPAHRSVNPAVHETFTLDEVRTDKVAWAG